MVCGAVPCTGSSVTSASDPIFSLDGKSVVWEPLPKQRAAMACPADEVFYGGKKGAAKTDLLIMRPAPVLQKAHEKWLKTGVQQRCRMVIFRKTTKKEARDMIDRTLALYPILDPTMGRRGFNETMLRWRFTSGAEVVFSHLDGPNDYRDWGGVELVGFGVDQVEECLAYDEFKFIVANVRTTDADYDAMKWVLLTGNPGGPHADWIYNYFIEPAPEGNRLLTQEIKVKDGTESVTYTRAFVPAHLHDNPYYYNDGKYEAKLRTLSAQEQAWYLHGQWTFSANNYFQGCLDPEIHFIRSFPIPSSWEIKMGLDWGATAPAACLWGARDQDNRLYFIDEEYGPGITGSRFAQRILRKFENQQWSKDKTWTPTEVYGLIDPSATRVHSVGDALDVTAAMQAQGLRLFPANNDRVLGWRQMKERMANQRDGKPAIYIFEDRCPNLKRQLSRVMPDPRRPDDIDTKLEDHALDAARYRCMDDPLYFGDTAARDDEATWLNLARKQAFQGQQSTGYGD